MSTAFLPNGHSAVMNMRVEDDESLDDFPTPPWATRALIEHVLWPSLKNDLPRMRIVEPACGRRIMSDVLEEYCPNVLATDIASYEDEHTLPPDMINNYLDLPNAWPYQMMVTNPPFNRALDFVQKALGEARCAVAVLVRTSWKEGQERYEKLFQPRPPTIIAQFVERVPMIKGVWNPKASTATSYAWFVWDTERPLPPGSPSKAMWIPPCREALTKPDDDIRYGVRGLREWLGTQMAYVLDEMQKDLGKERAKLERQLLRLEERALWLDSIGPTRHD